MFPVSRGQHGASSLHPCFTRFIQVIGAQSFEVAASWISTTLRAEMMAFKAALFKKLPLADYLLPQISPETCFTARFALLFSVR